MASPTTTANNWFGSMDIPSKLFDWDREYELYEQEDEFVLAVELPGFDREAITASWARERFR